MKTHSYLLGGVDEISPFHYNIETLSGAYKNEAISNKQLYETDSPGCVVGEGSAMFVVLSNIFNCQSSSHQYHTQHRY
jgi:hypothetical protein